MAKPVSEAPDHLTMNLFAPGMSALHRAGLGGLACTLKAMERQHKDGLLAKSKLPAAFDGEIPPWEITEQSITLRFGKPEKASSYLEKLFEFGFGIRKDGLINLPGQYETEPSAAVLADLQAGFFLTFLQHGTVKKLATDTTTATYESDGGGHPGVVVEYRKCSSFKHQDCWKELVNSKGCLDSKPVKVDGPISPGSLVRHNAFGANSTVKDPVERMLPLYFALVGCLSLPVNRGVAALIVPEVTDLTEFIYDRPAMTPTTATDCQIANAADAAFRAQVRLRKSPRRIAQTKVAARKTMESRPTIPGCYSMTFMPTAWASQQKSRVATLHVAPGEDRVLDRYERALSYLPTRIKTRIVKESTGRGKAKVTKERPESFRADSVVRPLIAENLALNRKWYSGFLKLMTRINPATEKPYRDQLNYPEERKGLHAMIADETMWDEEGERVVVQAMHEAISHRLGQIRRDTDGDNAKGLSQATKNRWQRFRDKLRIDLAGAKTESHVRFALMDLFSRAGSNSVLRDSWEKLLPVVRKDWHLARDLGLLALASYAGRNDSTDDQAPETK